VSLVRLKTGKLNTEKVNTWKWGGYVRFNISKEGNSKYREVSCFYVERREWLRKLYNIFPRRSVR